MLTRRKFLQAATAGACVTLAGRLAAAEPALPVLGFSLYGMKGLPVSEAIRQCARIGYRTVELSLLRGYETEPSSCTKAQRRELRDQLGASRVRASALLLSLDLTDEKALPAALDQIK